MATVDDVRRVALLLPRTTEHLIRDRVKFRVGAIVYAGFSRDETLMGFGFPRDERIALVASDPQRFLMPIDSDLRYPWVLTRIELLSVAEATEFVRDAWAMVVPKFLIRREFGADDPRGQVRQRRSLSLGQDG